MNGRIVLRPDAEKFREALRWVAESGSEVRNRLAEGVSATAREAVRSEADDRIP